MGARKMIYSTILAVIYIAASLLSPLSVLTCTHPHHTHHSAEQGQCSCGAHHDHNHDHAIDCSTLSFEAQCCDHDHELLGDKHVQIVPNNERYSNAQNIQHLLFASFAILCEAECFSSALYATEFMYGGDEQLPLQAAFIRYDSLRAPPVLA